MVDFFMDVNFMWESDDCSILSSKFEKNVYRSNDGGLVTCNGADICARLRVYFYIFIFRNLSKDGMFH